MFAPQPFTALATTLSPSRTEHWAQNSARWLWSLYDAEMRDYSHYSTYCRVPVKCDQCYWTLNIIIAVMAVKNCAIGRNAAPFWVEDVAEKGRCLCSVGLKQLRTHISAPFKAELDERLRKRHFATASWGPECFLWMWCRTSDAKNKVLSLETCRNKCFLLSNLTVHQQITFPFNCQHTETVAH